MLIENEANILMTDKVCWLLFKPLCARVHLTLLFQNGQTVLDIVEKSSDTYIYLEEVFKVSLLVFMAYFRFHNTL